MCTALGLIILILAIVLILFCGYYVFNWFDNLCGNRDSEDIPWILQSIIGIFVIILIILILLSVGCLGMACYGLYCIAPTVGCYVLGHI